MRKLATSSLLLVAYSFNSFSQSAIGQLEHITGERIDRYQVPVNGPTPVEQDQEYYANMDYYNQQYTAYLREQANSENEAGIKAYNKGNYALAARHFRIALKMDPTVEVYKTNLNNSEQQLANQKESEYWEKYYAKADAAFLKSYNSDSRDYVKQLNRTSKGLASYVPELNSTRKIISEGVVLGLMSFQDSFDGQSLTGPKGNLINAQNVYATGTAEMDVAFWKEIRKVSFELFRGLADNITKGDYTLLATPNGKRLVERMSGNHYNTLYAHSNGATVTEALIRKGIITVDELHIMGGDRSMMNFDGYNDLVDKGLVKKIVVWYTPGDMIPKGTSSFLLHPGTLMNEEHKKTFNAIENNLEYTTKDGKVQYKSLRQDNCTDCPGQQIEWSDPKKWFDGHNYKTYVNLMKSRM